MDDKYYGYDADMLRAMQERNRLKRWKKFVTAPKNKVTKEIQKQIIKHNMTTMLKNHLADSYELWVPSFPCFSDGCLVAVGEPVLAATQEDRTWLGFRKPKEQEQE